MSRFIIGTQQLDFLDNCQCNPELWIWMWMWHDVDVRCPVLVPFCCVPGRVPCGGKLWGYYGVICQLFLPEQ